MTDRSGKVECVSSLPMRVEQKALRIAPEAKIVIPGRSLPRLGNQYTVSAWILKRSTPDVTPILTRGAHPLFALNFAVAWRYPVLSMKYPDAPSRWEGVHTLGDFGRRIYYPEPSWQVPGSGLVERSGCWRQITGVYDSGKVTLYIDGKKVAERPAGKRTSPPQIDSDFIIGAERISGESRNFLTADMLLNDLRFYQSALTAAEVGALYRQDRPRYPEGDLIPPGENHLNALAPCDAYLDPEFDPGFKRKLKLTGAYEKRLADLPPFEPVTRAEIRGGGGAPRLLINGKPSFPIQFAPVYMYPDGKPRFREARAALRDFAAAGILKAGISIGNDQRTGAFWLEEGKYDFSSVDRKMRDAVEANPQVLILVHFFIAPPEWFLKRFPDEIEKAWFGHQLRDIPFAGLLNSERWLEVSTRMFRDLVAHMERADYGGHIYGYLPGGGQSGEWYWPGGVIGGVPGYSKATEQNFRSYLKEKYRNDSARLRKSWNDPAVTLEKAAVPSPEARRAAETLLFRDPSKAMAVIDFRDYMSAAALRHIRETTRAVKEASGGRKVVGVYSGYPFAMTAPKLFNSGLQNTGAVFRLSSVDFLATPIDYRRRRGGEPGLCTNPFNGSSLLHGKLLEHENDIRSHFHHKLESGRPSDLAETLSVVRRGFGDALTCGGGLWYYLFDNAWFHQEEIMETIRALGEAGTGALNGTRDSVAEVAVIFDEHSPKWLAQSGSPFLNAHTEGFRQEAVRSGIPVDFYLLDDLADSRMKSYKLYFFLNAYSLTAEQRGMIRSKLEREGATAVWCYAPGALDGSRLSPDAMKELTGMRFRTSLRTENVAVDKAEPDSALAASVLNGRRWRVGPLFEVDDPGAKILARSGTLPVLAEKRGGAVRNLFLLTPPDRAFLTALADESGVHVYSRSGDVLSVSQDNLMLHTSRGGVKRIRLPEVADVYELGGKKVFEKVREFQVELPEKHTVIYRMVKGTEK